MGVRLAVGGQGAEPSRAPLGTVVDLVRLMPNQPAERWTTSYVFFLNSHWTFGRILEE